MLVSVRDVHEWRLLKVWFTSSRHKLAANFAESDRTKNNYGNKPVVIIGLALH